MQRDTSNERRASAAWCALVVLVLAPSVANAQEWPDDDKWRVLYCGGVPSFDPLRDEAGAVGERDVVGDRDAPALHFFADDDYLYFRMRLDAAPTNGTDLRPFGWGVEIDTDGVRTTYELLGQVDGITNPDAVVIAHNTVQRVDDPSDPAEETLASYEAATHARAVEATGPFASSFGGDADYFIDWALPFVDLDGVHSALALVFVMGTSSSATAIDADLACRDDASGAPRLGEVSTDPVRPDGVVVVDTDDDGLSDDEEIAIGTDPNARDTDGDGWNDGDEVRAGTDPTDPDSVPNDNEEPPPGDGIGIRGGPGGCAMSGPAASPWAAGLLGLALAFALRRRPR